MTVEVNFQEPKDHIEEMRKLFLEELPIGNAEVIDTYFEKLLKEIEVTKPEYDANFSQINGLHSTDTSRYVYIPAPPLNRKKK